MVFKNKGKAGYEGEPHPVKRTSGKKKAEPTNSKGSLGQVGVYCAGVQKTQERVPSKRKTGVHNQKAGADTQVERGENHSTQETRKAATKSKTNVVGGCEVGKYYWTGVGGKGKNPKSFEKGRSEG